MKKAEIKEPSPDKCLAYFAKRIDYQNAKEKNENV